MFLGDIHGNFNLVSQYVKKFDLVNCHIIQVGDFGVGFKTFEKEKRELDYLNNFLVKMNTHLYVVRGNHDYKPYFDNDPFKFENIHLISDYTVLELCEKKILFVGGAISVDRGLRKTKRQITGVHTKTTPGVESWWPDEEFVLDRSKLENLTGIQIVVTHTCPFYCPPENSFGLGAFVTDIIKETGDTELKRDILVERNQVAEAFRILKANNDIKFHMYGHYHKSILTEVDGIKHRLLGIGELWEEKDYNNIF